MAPQVLATAGSAIYADGASPAKNNLGQKRRQNLA
jgi:hypothetical protein